MPHVPFLNVGPGFASLARQALFTGGCPILVLEGGSSPLLEVVGLVLPLAPALVGEVFRSPLFSLGGDGFSRHVQAHMPTGFSP